MGCGCAERRQKLARYALRAHAWLENHLRAKEATDPQAARVEAQGAMDQAGTSEAADGQTVAPAES